MAPPQKRPPSGSLASSSKRAKTGIAIGSRSKRLSTAATATRDKSSNGDGAIKKLRQEFISLFTLNKSYQQNGISNSQLKKQFPDPVKYKSLVLIINSLSEQSRLIMSRSAINNELIYKLINEEEASKFDGLDVQARMVYQIIEKSSNQGIWTKDIKIESKIPSTALAKIFKALESRKLIKPIKAVNAKSKKRYMLYDLQPSKEVTGGPWYTDMEFDHEFISILRTFVMNCVKSLNKGKGVTSKEIAAKIKLAKVSKEELSLQEVRQLMQTLAFDYMIEQSGLNQNGEALFIAAKHVTAGCDFKWWDGVLCPDFHFREIKFEDGVVLGAHEPHHHSAS